MNTGAYKSIQKAVGLNRFFVSEYFRTCGHVGVASYDLVVSITSSSANTSGHEHWRIQVHSKGRWSQSLLRQRILPDVRTCRRGVLRLGSLNHFFVSEYFRT